MQLNAPVVVPGEISGDAAILRTGPIATLEVEEEAEDQGEKDKRRKDLAEIIPDDPGIEEVEARGAAEAEGMGNKPGGDSIERVAGAVAGECDGAFENLPGEPLEEESLEPRKMRTIVAALVLGQGQCAAMERQPAVVSSGESEPLNGSKVHTIQKMIVAGGVERMRNSGRSVVRPNSTTGLSLPAAQVVSFSADKGSDLAAFQQCAVAHRCRRVKNTAGNSSAASRWSRIVDFRQPTGP